VGVAQISADIWFRCYGVSVNGDYLADGLATARTPQGQVRVTETLNVDGHGHIYALGDLTDLAEAKMAGYAMKHRALSGGGGPVTFDGEFYQVSALEPAPVPAAPVWTGSVGPKSLAVTGRLADGWIPGHAADWLSPRYRNSRPVIDDAAATAGRDPEDIATIYNLPGLITPAPLATTRDGDGRGIGGSVEQWVEELTGAVLEYDASGFVYFAADDTPADVTLGRWAQEIVPAVREAVARDA
jgi:hypothetical protein